MWACGDRPRPRGSFPPRNADSGKHSRGRVTARSAARIELGGVEQVKEQVRDSRTGAFLDSLLQDLRFALRSLRRTSGLTAFVVITLALGIGMTSGTFSMVDALIFRPYPVPHPSCVVTLVSTTHDSSFDDFSYCEYRTSAAKRRATTA